MLGLCSHGLAVARALADAGVAVLAVEKNMQLPGAHTRVVQRIHRVPDFGAESLLAGLLELRRQLPAGARVVLFPVNDNHVRLIGQHLGTLTPHFCVIWADAAEMVLRLQNKDSLEAFSRARGLNYPPSAVFTSPTVAAHATRGLRYPLIIKPVRPLSSFKALIARDAGHLDELLAEHRADLPILAQDYIAGDDRRLYFVALLLQDGAVLRGAVGRKLASFPPAMGQTTVAETVHDDEAMDIARRFFAGTGISGPASLELKRDAQGRFWVIEPTVGRTDFWAALFVRAGFNRPHMVCQLAMGQPVAPLDRFQECIWFDTERAPLAYLGQAWATRSWRPHGKRPVFPYIDRRDWRPALRACQMLLGRAVRRLARARSKDRPQAVRPRPLG